jgi:hypothetical protein
MLRLEPSSSGLLSLPEGFISWCVIMVTTHYGLDGRSGSGELFDVGVVGHGDADFDVAV